MPTLFRRVISPIRELSDSGKLSGLLLLLATVFSLAISNSAFGESYLRLWETHVGVAPLEKTVSHWINDGLMVIFFFLVGLEIKREVLYGELTNLRAALLPVVAAVGGVTAPAIIYLLFTAGTDLTHGWAVPTATDIAFSLGILSLLGDRVPFSLRIFLTALAIIDDLMAVVIIAIFYTADLNITYLLGSAGLLAVLIALNRLKIGWLPLYFLLGLALWYCVLKSGVHATIAGVLLALTIPTDAIERIEHALQKPVSYIILPVFALANTAIIISADTLQELTTPLSLGIVLGLLLGKPIGIFGTCWLMIKTGMASLPANMNWRRLLGLGFTAGIGFTMAIFIANLSFSDASRIDLAKLAVILGSTLSALVGIFLLRPHHNIVDATAQKPELVKEA